MFVKKHQIGKVYDAPYDVVLGENNVFFPDIMFVSNKNSKIITEKNITGAPDLIIEILPLRPVKFFPCDRLLRPHRKERNLC